MTLKGQTGIGLRHATTVVDDLYGRATGIHHRHVDVCGTGIDRVLNQFLDDRGRALNHLTGGYLVGYGVG